MTTLTKAALDALLHVNAETGALTWSHSRGRVAAGTKAGRLHRDGYVVVQLDGKQYMAHRLVWLHVHGAFPGSLIDHKNGCRASNAIGNLRLADHSTNGQNRRSAASHNKVGLLGVKRVKGSKTFSASINVGGAEKWLGTFATADAAHNAYIAAKQIHHATGALLVPRAAA